MSEALFEETASSVDHASSSRMTWNDLQKRVKDAKRYQLTCNHLPTAFVARRHPDSTSDAASCPRPHGRTRLYFLGMPTSVGGRRENTLLYADFGVPAPRPEPDVSDGDTSALPNLAWRPLLDADGCAAGTAAGELSREEQLLRERRRIMSVGITAYEVHPQSGRFAFILAGGLLATCKDTHFTTGQVAPQVMLRESIHGSGPAVKLDPKVCPAAPQLVAYVCDGDLWVHNEDTGCDARLTFARQGGGGTSASSASSSYIGGITLEEPLSCGAPPFVIQEEFDRCTGYWWQPANVAGQGSDIYHILYEEVDESEVDVVFIPSAPTGPSANYNVTPDAFRYPRAGTNNATSTVKVVQFRLNDSGQVVDVVNLQLWPPLQTAFPWIEYFVRLDWHPTGSSVWLQAMDRLQQQLVLLLLPLDLFVTAEVARTMPAVYLSQYASRIIVLREETSSSWINVHDGLHFLREREPGVVSFLWLSECTGYQHLYLCHVSSSAGDSKQAKSVPLTSGEWEVNGQQLWVDEERQVVFFMGTRDTVLESHLYCVSYDKCTTPMDVEIDGDDEQQRIQGHIPWRLTQKGYSHVISMDLGLGIVVDTFSSVSSSATCRVSQLRYPEVWGLGSSDSWAPPTLFPIALLLAPAELEQCYGCCRSERGRCSGAHTVPKLTSYKSSTSGAVTHCLVYEPAGLEPGRRYPTVLFVYGGPQVQLVTNADKSLRYTRLSTMASLGYAVIMMDCRGSKGRGMAYESHIKNRLGSVEVADQVEGLYALAAQLGYIDLDRVAVHGWSYGGYLALMALAQRPDVFKVCIAGAPVTAWQLYDTAYTERYMGKPKDNEHGYLAGSVVTYADYFPDSPGRLLIIHGLIDENVHFFHTSVLLNALVKAGKPYQMQVYPAERHGIRSPEANEHFETTVLHFLCQNL